MTEDRAIDGQMAIAKSMTEKQLSQHVVNLARMLGWLVHRDPTWRSTGADPGYPDLTLARADKRLLFAELKAEGGKLTPAQRRWREAIEFDGDAVEFYEWRPTDWLNGTIEKVLR